MKNFTWQKLEVECAQPISETVAAYFSDLTGSGVEIQDSETGVSGAALVIAYLADNNPALGDTLASARNYLNEIASLFPQYPPPLLRQCSITDEDWSQKWKENFKPFKLTKSLVIKPSWETYIPEGDEKVIEIDPGMAFGTGHHASTKLAALLIEKHLEKNQDPPGRILDIGTGTGILAICCALLGCKNIIAIDNDPEAITTALDNISTNNMSNSIEAVTTPLESLNGPFDLVIANIIHNTLVEMAPVINTLLNKKGTLIMAGILAGEQSRNITRIYAEQGIQTISEKISGEWTALLLEKNFYN